ncbi:MAG TPA: MFS transporter [Methylomirabilota bacterium]|jgi:ACS family hexuronate transporter-like MFS transporter|nr:MFS transporter [Methylomirabilota bacterium]
MIGMIFLLTVVNYIDRMTLSVLAPTIMKQFAMTNVAYSRVVFMFLLAYTISQTVSGKVLDRVGTRAGFMLFVGIWTVASMLHAAARSVTQLGACRFFLGIGEAGNWPGAAKAVAEWFPVRERAFAMAVFNSGASIGAVVAPPLIVWVALTFGWRYAFFIGASLSLLVLTLWFLFYRTPDRHPRLSERERAHILSDQTPAEAATAVSRRPWLSLFRHRQVWALVAGRFFTDPIWWFLISWLPNYLKAERGFSLALIGMLAWIPFLFADLGNLSGGGISSLLIRRGWSVDRARRVVMLGSAFLVPVGVATVVTGRSDAAALAGVSLIAFCFQSWIVNVITIPSDCFPKQDVGSVAGIGGTAAGVASMLFTLLVGYLVDHFSYTPVYLIVGAMGPLGAVLFFVIMRRIERVPAVVG